MPNFDVEMDNFNREFQAREQAKNKVTLKAVLGVTLLCMVGFACGYYYSSSISNVEQPISLEQTKEADSVLRSVDLQPSTRPTRPVNKSFPTPQCAAPSLDGKCGFAKYGPSAGSPGATYCHRDDDNNKQYCNKNGLCVSDSNDDDQKWKGYWVGDYCSAKCPNRANKLHKNGKGLACGPKSKGKKACFFSQGDDWVCRRPGYCQKMTLFKKDKTRIRGGLNQYHKYGSWAFRLCSEARRKKGYPVCARPAYNGRCGTTSYKLDNAGAKYCPRTRNGDKSYCNKNGLCSKVSRKSDQKWKGYWIGDYCKGKCNNYADTMHENGKGYACGPKSEGKKTCFFGLGTHWVCRRPGYCQPLDEFRATREKGKLNQYHKYGSWANALCEDSREQINFRKNMLKGLPKRK